MLLTTRLHVDVIACESGSELVATLAQHDFASESNEIRAVILVHSVSLQDTKVILHRLGQRFSDVPVILIDRQGTCTDSHAATRTLRGQIDNAELIDAVKTIAARKRGPKRNVFAERVSA
jgi:hypothetical protein